MAITRQAQAATPPSQTTPPALATQLVPSLPAKVDNIELGNKADMSTVAVEKPTEHKLQKDPKGEQQKAFRGGLRRGGAQAARGGGRSTGGVTSQVLLEI